MSGVQIIHKFQLFPGETVVQHLAAKLRIGGLNGNIDRCKLHLNDTVHVLLFHIRQSDIISLQERKTGIIIFEIQCLTHSRRHLIDKTKNALVTAGTVITHQTIFKFNPQIIVIFFLDLQKPFFPIRLADQYFYILILDHITIIKNVLYFLVIYSQKDISRLDLHRLGNGIWVNLTDQMSLILIFLTQIIFLPKFGIGNKTFSRLASSFV